MPESPGVGINPGERVKDVPDIGTVSLPPSTLQAMERKRRASLASAELTLSSGRAPGGNAAGGTAGGGSGTAVGGGGPAERHGRRRVRYDCCPECCHRFEGREWKQLVASLSPTGDGSTRSADLSDGRPFVPFRSFKFAG